MRPAIILGLVAVLPALAYDGPLHPTAVHAAIEARGTPECLSVAAKYGTAWTDFPVPDATLFDFLQTAAPTLTNVCADPVITGSVGSQFSSWATQYSSWLTTHAPEIKSVLSACSDIPEVKSQIPAGATECLSQFLAGAGRVTSTSKNAGPRETGMVAVAALAVGFVVAAV